VGVPCAAFVYAMLADGRARTSGPVDARDSRVYRHSPRVDTVKPRAVFMVRWSERNA